jgi:hypothetical protein
VAAENRQKPGRDILLLNPKRDSAADLNKAFAFGLNVQGMERLAHWNDRGFERDYAACLKTQDLVRGSMSDITFHRRPPSKARNSPPCHEDLSGSG